MPVVPAGDRTKSIAVGTPYSPVVSFNPDKKLFFDTHITTLGVLAGGVITSDGVNATIPAGTVVIQNGIIIEFVNPVLVPIPAIAFPKILYLTNADENPGSPVTVDFLTAIAPPTVELARLDPDNTTVVLPKQISIRALCQEIQTLQANQVDALQDSGLVQANINELNVLGPNLSVTPGGGDRVDLENILDVEDDGSPIESRVKKINYTGTGVTVTNPGSGDVDVDIPGGIETKDEGTQVVSSSSKLNFVGAGVEATQDGGDAEQTNVTINGTGGVVKDGIVCGLIVGDGGTRQLNVTGLQILKNGTVSAVINTTLAIGANASGFPRTDLVQWDGTTLAVKPGTASASFTCPTPDGGNIPVAVVLIPPGAPDLVRNMNKQGTFLEAVIVAYYYAGGGLHASRVATVSNPSTTSLTFVDADDMALNVYFPKDGFQYELNWDTVMCQEYGLVREGGFIGYQFDGADENDFIISRRSLWGSPSLLGVFEYCFYLNIHYNRLVTQGSHLLKGRYKRDPFGTSIALDEKRRRIWVTEMA